jgi:hypothetical protein
MTSWLGPLAMGIKLTQERVIVMACFTITAFAQQHPSIGEKHKLGRIRIKEIVKFKIM